MASNVIRISILITRCIRNESGSSMNALNPRKKWHVLFTLVVSCQKRPRRERFAPRHTCVAYETHTRHI